MENNTCQFIRDRIYSMLITNSECFRDDFDGMFDSDDDVEVEIDSIIDAVKNDRPIHYTRPVSSEFNNKLVGLATQYIDLGGENYQRNNAH